MRVYIQWSRANPQDWEAHDITSDSDIRRLPKRDEPAQGDPGTTEADVGGDFGVKTVLDVAHPDADDPGWIYDMSIQGQHLSGADVLHLDVDGGALVVTRVNHDPDDWAGDRYAQRWRYQMPTLDNTLDPPRLQPRITLEEVWCEGAVRTARYQRRPGNAIVSAWTDFSLPGPENKRRYGIWQTPENMAAQEAAQTSVRGYPEWIASS